MKRICPRLRRFRSGGIGSFTLTIMSASAKIGSGPSRNARPRQHSPHPRGLSRDRHRPRRSPGGHDGRVGDRGRDQPDPILMVFDFLRQLPSALFDSCANGSCRVVTSAGRRSPTPPFTISVNGKLNGSAGSKRLPLRGFLQSLAEPNGTGLDRTRHWAASRGALLEATWVGSGDKLGFEVHATVTARPR